MRAAWMPSLLLTSTPTTLADCACWRANSRSRFTSPAQLIRSISAARATPTVKRVNLDRRETFRSGSAFQIGDITITPFTIPHDAIDPVGFTFRSDGIKIGICTDLGYMPASVRDHLRGCHVLMLESNHDLEMLRGGPYPWSVKQRVMSRVGHLSNDALADFLTTDYDGGAEFLILAHLSEQNNHPEIARMTAERALGAQRDLLHNRLLLAAQHEPLAAVRL